MNGPLGANERQKTEAVAQLRARLDVAVADIKRVLDDIEATAEGMTRQEGSGR